MTQNRAHLKTKNISSSLSPSNLSVSAMESQTHCVGAEPVNSLGQCVPMVLSVSMLYVLKLEGP